MTLWYSFSPLLGVKPLSYAWMAALLLFIFLDHYQGSDQRENHHKNRYHFEICHDDHPLSFVKEGEKLSAIVGTLAE